MKFIVICDAFPPQKNSAAVQMHALVKEFVKKKHDITIVVPTDGLHSKSIAETIDGYRLVKIRSPKIRNVSNIRRAVAELFLPVFFIFGVLYFKLNNEKWDGVIWYSPTIFLGVIAHFIKKSANCHSYLIVRDIFPNWALDLGILKPGLAYHFFKYVAQYQYFVADTIGVQSPGNLSYFENIKSKRIEVLHNWLDDDNFQSCSINLSQTHLKGRKIFLYTGNMGIAQNVESFLHLAELYLDDDGVGFLFVGRGSSLQTLRRLAMQKQLNNVLFMDEIAPEEILGLCQQSAIGLISLNKNHKTHNIPGKFITYMKCGLPCLADINPGNDLSILIKDYKVGEACESDRLDDLWVASKRLILEIEEGTDFRKNCESIFEHHFKSTNAVKKIISSFKNDIVLDHKF